MEDRELAVVALGMFDGMHIGHRALIGQAVELAHTRGCAAAVYTFSNHPMSVLGGQPRMLSAPQEREAVMRGLGVSDVRMEPFTRTLANSTPEAFIDLLLARWRIHAVVVGFNYTFGAQGAGTPALLHRLGARHGFDALVLPPVQFCGAPVSSTRIRALIEQGELAPAREMLTVPYALSGTVIANKRLGRRIGFPTANIAPAADRVLPKRGVYAVQAALEGVSYRAVTNVGMNPTVHGERLSIETHLLDYDGDAYGRTLSVAFLARLRDERRFDSTQALREQIARDVEAARRL